MWLIYNFKTALTLISGQRCIFCTRAEKWFVTFRRSNISGQVCHAIGNVLCQKGLHHCHHANSPAMSCERLFSRLPGHLITFRQSFLIFAQGYICNFFPFSSGGLQTRPPRLNLFFHLTGSFRWAARTIPSCWLFFSSGPHQICISSSESSVCHTAIQGERCSSHPNTLSHESQSKDDQTWPNVFFCFALFPESTMKVCAQGEEAAPLRTMCWYCDTVKAQRQFLTVKPLKHTGKASRSKKFHHSFLTGARMGVVKPYQKSNFKNSVLNERISTGMFCVIIGIRKSRQLHCSWQQHTAFQHGNVQ